MSEWKIAWMSVIVDASSYIVWNLRVNLSTIFLQHPHQQHSILLCGKTTDVTFRQRRDLN